MMTIGKEKGVEVDLGVLVPPDLTRGHRPLVLILIKNEIIMIIETPLVITMIDGGDIVMTVEIDIVRMNFVAEVIVQVIGRGGQGLKAQEEGIDSACI